MNTVNHMILMNHFREQLREEATGTPSFWDDRETRKRKTEKRRRLKLLDKRKAL